jgi:peptide/nickel transport system substrate-binding protein
MTRTARILLACALLAAAGCGGRSREASPGVIRLATANAPTNLDPRVGSDEASQKIHQLLYNSLVRIDGRLRVVPDLATEVTNPDPLTYVAVLREGVRFHDGRELTAEDVAYTFGSFLDPDFTSPRKGAYRLLDGVDVIDRRTVRFRLKEPFGSFPINLVMGIVPAGIGAAAARHPIGTGPYRLARFVIDDRVELAPFADHFDGAPDNDGLVLRVVPDETMRGLEVRKGSVDIVVNDIAPDVVHQLRDDPEIAITTTPGTDYAYLGMNLRDPILSDVRVRRAIGHAIDRNAIVRYLRRELATVAIGILPPMSWFFEPDVLQFTHDPARARALLDEAGFPDPDGDGPRPRMRLTLRTSTAEAYRLQAAVIQRDLQQVGIAVDVRSTEFQTLYTDVLLGNFQLYTLQWVGVSDPDMLRRVFHSSQMPPVGFNRVFYERPEVDRLLDRATRSTDDEERRQLYGEVQTRIAADVPYISLWYKTNVAVYRRDLRGVQLSPLADFAFLRHVSRATATD